MMHGCWSVGSLCVAMLERYDGSVIDVAWSDGDRLCSSSRNLRCSSSRGSLFGWIACSIAVEMKLMVSLAMVRYNVGIGWG
jgi:hypothetical protein